MCQETLLALLPLVTGMSSVVVVNGYLIHIHVPAFDVESLGGTICKITKQNHVRLNEYHPSDSKNNPTHSITNTENNSDEVRNAFVFQQPTILQY